jgi:AcrR family transcriptional regulator
VLASQRDRIVAAMLDRAAEKGYAATTVSDVVGAARVSRNAFYELFRDKEDCYLAACDETWRLLQANLYAQAAEATWVETLRKGMRVYLRFWQEQPRFAYAYLIELPAAGRRAQEQRDRAHRDATQMFDALGALARRQQPDLSPLPPLTTRVLAAGITEVVAQEVRAGRLDRLGALEGHLTAHVVRTLADERTAEQGRA